MGRGRSCDRAARAVVRLGLTALALLGTAGATGAQGLDPDPNVPVTARPRPDYDPLGIALGGLIAYPSVRLGVLLDDNVRAEDRDERRDAALLVVPAIGLVGQGSRYRLAVDMAAEIARYREQTGEDAEQAFIRGNGRLDLTGDLSLSGRGEVARLREARDDPEDAGLREPQIYNLFAGDVALERHLSRFSLSVGGGLARYEYLRNAGVSQDDRDRTVVGGAVRVGFAQSPRVRLFVENRVGREIYDESRDRSGADRSFTEVGVAGGVALDFTSVLFGEASAGVTRAFFDDDDFEDETALTMAAALTWNVTQLTTLTLDASREFDPTTQSGSSVNLRTEGRVGVDHELRRNVIVGAGLGARQNRFESTGEDENELFTDLRLTYLVNRRLAFGLNYEFTTRDASDSTRDFNRNRFLFSIIGRL